jgi:hypothetical protein
MQVWVNLDMDPAVAPDPRSKGVRDMGRFIFPRPKRKTRHRLSLDAVGILGDPRNPGLTTYQPGFGAAPAASLEVGRVGLASRSPAMRRLSARDPPTKRLAN